MTGWLIIKTEYKHELSVARQIEALGFEAWVPSVKYIHARRMPSAAHPSISLKSKPLRPGLLLAFLSASGLDEALSARGAAGVVRSGPYGPPYCVPEAAVKAFKEMVASINEPVERSYNKRLEGRRPKKGRVVLRGFSPENKDAIINKLWRLEVPEMQEAA